MITINLKTWVRLRKLRGIKNNVVDRGSWIVRILNNGLIWCIWGLVFEDWYCKDIYNNFTGQGQWVIRFNFLYAVYKQEILFTPRTKRQASRYKIHMPSSKTRKRNKPSPTVQSNSHKNIQRHQNFTSLPKMWLPYYEYIGENLASIFHSAISLWNW